MTALKIALLVLIVLTSILLTLTVLMHKGKGGGVSDMFGGGLSSTAGSSGVAERNLNRITLGILIVWVVSIIGFGLMQKWVF
ncbi:preprotein translocase subunit SecG [Schaalia hyovaginalis]|uniref:Protein-export membrane protein SecG n=1 Tax=Schaalia hyovaginalis TaxID=29316 RepID=A0A7K0K9C4_9ACTO|nr:preprotein translocase subunit SecG [Schaalia hyovaginalis]MBB6334691.1 preprotein translocase subunit SecG [Schaalia hyovaginalis]MCF2710229.1 preprotein translocase subunit SecG [Schaalia hyovaginalis]MCI6411762.1 preprotein translocase subunit SecG [Schaalia hyovaginalis]MCI6556158.1 preprotein translocase subunit SecG [Schaalia hyovaginalis]MCI7513119.1 preprotein translocase subunit SecG [Schaalia hyovaginalis]